MHGQVQLIGERPTYFPPFVNERFGAIPYWSCTFASLLNGANVGWRGEKPATVAEILALAKASGDPDRKGGSNSGHMITAIANRYDTRMRLRRLPPQRVQDRLAHGWAMVSGVTYADLPRRYRIDPGFADGHRVVLVGWQNGHSWILDPLADEGPGYTGDRIAWSDFEPAWWSSEQLWFREGMFLPQGRYGPRLGLPAPRPWVARKDATLDLLSPVRPGSVARRVRLPERLAAEFDALVQELAPEPANRVVGTRLRVSSGPYRGYLLDPATDGVEAELPDVAGLRPVKPPKNGRHGERPNPVGPIDPTDATFLAGRRFEWDRISKGLDPGGVLGRP